MTTARIRRSIGLACTLLLARCGSRPSDHDATMDAVMDATIDPDVPRQIAPLSTATVTSRRPTFHWQLAAGTDGAHVDICSDPACHAVIASLDATGSSARPDSDLPSGILYWRVRALTGGALGSGFGPTWEFTVGALSAPVDTSWGSNLDVNRDGFADVIAGAWGVNVDTGAAYLYLGSAMGLGAAPATTLAGPDGSYGQFGISVASAGDVNGDGFADVVVGAYEAQDATGRAYVYAGSATGLVARPLSIISGPDGARGGFGISVASAGDVNGDGFADVIVGASFVGDGNGSAYVYLGSASGLASSPATTLTGLDGMGGNFGGTVASAGDVNGDGFGDVAVAAYPAASTSGRVYVYLGSAAGLVSSPATRLAGADGIRELFGDSIACAGDVNGDGFADLIVGASGAVAGAGRADLFLGSAAGLASMPATRLIGYDGAYGGWGGSVASAGDANGDGFADVVVGAGGANDADGRAYIFPGGAMGLSIIAATTLDGASGHRGGFGSVVASGGDVNGDGFPDVLIVAHEMNGHPAQAFVYGGGAMGIQTSPATTLSGPAGFLDSAFGSSIAGRRGPRVRSADLAVLVL